MMAIIASDPEYWMVVRTDIVEVVTVEIIISPRYERQEDYIVNIISEFGAKSIR